jgi:tRNA pseudouridine38-40 synthase
MNTCAAMLIGKKDFECFSKVHTQVNNFICEVMLAKWEEKDGKLIFTIRANRFLRNMVRAVVGTLVEVGRGRITTEDFVNILESRNRSEAGQSVPAQALFLTEVHYDLGEK